MKSKYSKYEEEVRLMRSETGYGSDNIAQAISSKYPEEGINTSSFARHIRKKGWISPSIVDESMHRNNLNPSDNWKLSWIRTRLQAHLHWLLTQTTKTLSLLTTIR